ncbi:MAG: hypothetical protein BMS9Abin05_2694 [Rhodothermia bacterium]|nr:MAG: hypothetical protein BMS9Abin05_2694 [Rhodothermia bacterium]
MEITQLEIEVLSPQVKDEQGHENASSLARVGDVLS